MDEELEIAELKLGFASERELDNIVSRPTRKREIARGNFPAPVQVTEGRVGTPWVKVKKWMASRPPSQMKSPNPRAGKAGTTA